MCRRLTISEQLELQKKDRENFQKLCETDPDAAKELAIKRLTRCGILDSDGNMTPEAMAAFGDPWQEVQDGVFEADFDGVKAHVMSLPASGVFHWSVRFSRGLATGESDSLAEAKQKAEAVASAVGK